MMNVMKMLTYVCADLNLTIEDDGGKNVDGDDEKEDEAYVCAPHRASIAEILSHSPELSGPDWQRS